MTAGTPSRRAAGGGIRVASTRTAAAPRTALKRRVSRPGHDRPGQELLAELLHVHDQPLVWELTGRCAFATDFHHRSDRSPAGCGAWRSSDAGRV